MSPWWDEDDVPVAEQGDWASGVAYGGADLGSLTLLVLIDDRVVDTMRRPVNGSGYENAAVELGRGRVPPPSYRPPRPDPPRYDQELSWLRRVVGGVQALAQLDSAPLPDEPLDLSHVEPAVEPELRERLQAIGEQADDIAFRLFGTELRTVTRRLLGELAGSPSLFIHADRDDQAAGALVWAAAKANDLIGPGKLMPASAIQGCGGLRSSPADRGRTFARVVAGMTGTGYEPHRTAVPNLLLLGSPRYLTGDLRSQLVRLRDLALAEREAAVTSRPAASPADTAATGPSATGPSATAPFVTHPAASGPPVPF